MTFKHKKELSLTYIRLKNGIKNLSTTFSIRCQDSEKNDQARFNEKNYEAFSLITCRGVDKNEPKCQAWIWPCA